MEIKVTNCEGCPFIHYKADFAIKGYCKRLQEEIENYKDIKIKVLPNCPLKQGEITVKLETT